MKNLGEKVKFSEAAKSGLVEIKTRLPKWQETVLLAWVVAWTFCGLVVIGSFFGDYSRDVKLMLIAYIVFWIYFEYKAVYAFLWKKMGKEFILIDEDGIRYKRDLNGYGNSRSYFKENIKQFIPVDLKDRSFAKSYFNSFWMVGNETIRFEYLGKVIGIGLGLEDTERDEVIKFLKYQRKKLHLNNA